MKTRRTLRHLVVLPLSLLFLGNWLRRQTTSLTALASHDAAKEIVANIDSRRWSVRRTSVLRRTLHALRRGCATSTGGFDLTAENKNFFIVLLLDAHVRLFKLIDLFPDDLRLLDLLLDLTFVILIDADLVIKLGADLFEKLVQAR